MSIIQRINDVLGSKHNQEEAVHVGYPIVSRYDLLLQLVAQIAMINTSTGILGSIHLQTVAQVYSKLTIDVKIISRVMLTI